jgi:hypothetical protein
MRSLQRARSTWRRRRLSDVGEIVVMGLMILGIMALPLAGGGMLLALVVPPQVNSIAYLGGWERADTFMPVSYGQQCDDGGSCSTVTYGYLTGDHDTATWDGQVPLGKPFSVRAPVIAWGMGRQLTDGIGTAIGWVVIALLLESSAAALVWMAAGWVLG